jgi:hypothetical protein
VRAARLVALAALSMAAMPGSAQAGSYHVYSCRTPAGESAPVDGWSGSEAGAEAHAVNTCAELNGALVADLLEGVPRDSNTSIATWSFGAPSGERLAAAQLWRAGDAAGGVAAGGGFEIWFAGPENDLSHPSEYFGVCEAGSHCPNGVGDTTQPLGSTNLINVPAPNLGTHLYMSASCVGEAGGACPEAGGDPNHYAAVVYLYAADLTLEQTAGPSAGNVGGELASAPTVGGTSDVMFTASDPGSGVYEAVFGVDGNVVQRTVVNDNSGRCRDVGQTSDGSPAFLYVQPCPGSVSADVGLDTTRIANGAHHLVVSVIDAAGNGATVLDRAVTVYNPPPPGAPNGTNASANAHLAIRWKSTARAALTSSFGQVHTITGRLTAASGAPIGGARIDLLATPSSTGARGVAMTSPLTDAEGRFTVRLPRGIPSSTLRFAYSAHAGDTVPAATGMLTLRVRASIALTVTPRSASVGRSIFFRGRLRGGPVPAEGKQLVLEARSPGSAWIEFQVVRTNARGRFHASYRFKFPGPATYRFRARSEPESDYPFAAGASSPATVHEQ